MSRIIMIAAVIGTAYWYWSGPYQQRTHPDYAATLRANDQRMAECQRSAAYKLGATGSGAGAEKAQQDCADQYNLYFDSGHWHSYDQSRPD